MLFKSVRDEILYEKEIQKSRFIASVNYVRDEESALEFIDSVSQKYKDANHNAYAYIVEDKAVIKRYSDDKEPQGSAGMPILSAMEKADMKNIVCVVSRYFGGIKLGLGGLVRAYQNTFLEAVSRNLYDYALFTKLKCEIPYEDLSKHKYFLEKQKYDIFDMEYVEKVFYCIYVKKEEKDNLASKLQNLSVGKLKVYEEEDCELPCFNNRFIGRIKYD